ncbi:acetate/propionate family kinase [Rubritalea marina]|uniref:acetate/propionate family kinase n=1 Tax=Rubritalea marina TaxID=361055 RepID=UPI00037F0430|nr:acetate kinase [Rubritalea marina]
MIILSLNAGSSSLKFAVNDTRSSTSLMSGIVEKIGTHEAEGAIEHGPHTNKIQLQGTDHASAIKDVLAALNQMLESDGARIQAIGHRVVHGGSEFTGPTIITPAVIHSIERLSPLAPLHNPANLAAVKAAHHLYPELPQVAVFDTAFHQTIPEKAFRYAIPEEWFESHKIRKYGFHGTSHSYVSAEAIKRFGLSPDQSRIIVAHLGNGASISAIQGGKSIDTSMGLSPLDGLIMGTRSGSIDPSIHLYLAQHTGLTLEEITETLTKQSGMLALSQTSSDMRDIWALYREGDHRAILAMEMYLYRLNQTLLGQLAAFDAKLDALIFTGGIGENDCELRRRVLQSLAWIGFELSDTLNQASGDAKGAITTSTAPLAAIIKTNEELEIARQTASLC